jgi:WD40 repeat protein
MLYYIPPDSTLCAPRCASLGLDCAIQIWDVRTANPVSTLSNYQEFVSRIYFSSGASQFVSLSRVLNSPTLVQLWDVGTGDCIALMEAGRQFTDISFDVGGISIILRDNDDSMQRLTSSSARNH